MMLDKSSDNESSQFLRFLLTFFTFLVVSVFSLLLLALESRSLIFFVFSFLHMGLLPFPFFPLQFLQVYLRWNPWEHNTRVIWIFLYGYYILQTHFLGLTLFCSSSSLLEGSSLTEVPVKPPTLQCQSSLTQDHLFCFFSFWLSVLLDKDFFRRLLRTCFVL